MEILNPGQEEVNNSVWFQCSSCSVFLCHPVKFLDHVSQHANTKRVRQSQSQAELSPSYLPCIKTCVVKLTRIEVVIRKAQKTILSPICLLSRLNTPLHPATTVVNDVNHVYRCRICNKSTSCKFTLRNHMMRHIGDHPFACDICGYTTVEAFLLHYHISATHGEEALKGFLGKRTIGKHKPVPSSCSICHAVFPSMKYLRRHNQAKCKTRPATVNCHICAKPFASRGSLTRHVASHSGGQTFICFCGKRYTRNEKLKVHRRNQHPELQERPPPVHVDRVTLQQRKESWRSRYKMKMLRKCDKCDKILSSPDKLEAHMLIHEGIKPFYCIKCGQKFRRKGNVGKHMWKHSNEMIKQGKSDLEQEFGMTEPHHGSFKCDQCLTPSPLEFISVEFLELHQQQVHKDLPTLGPNRIRCSECSRTLSSKNELVRHMLIHRGIKPFDCNICGGKFRRKDYLKYHLVKHQKESIRLSSTGAPPELINLPLIPINEASPNEFGAKGESDEYILGV